jgi:AcrR family transcriptional regulator
MADPLDTLFRPTALPAAPPSIASAAPVRETGTRTRAGNAMNRTRAALLDGARRAVEASGTKITMAQVAAAAGVAKATLYNHFRTREAVLDALLLDEVARLAERAAGLPLRDALAATASALSDSPLLRTLARIEPATVAMLGRIDQTAEGWQQARAAVGVALAADDRGGTEFVLRWLASFLLTPARPAVIGADVSVLIAALPSSSSGSSGSGVAATA